MRGTPEIASPWHRLSRPPANTIGGLVFVADDPAVGVNLAVQISQIRVFDTGIEVTFDACMRPGTDFGITFTGVSGRGRELNTGIGSLLVGARLGVSLTATNLDAPAPPGVFNVGFSGAHSSGNRAQVSYFINPTPTPLGDLTVAYGWPAMGIAEKKVRIAGDLLQSALARSVALWGPN